MLVVTGGETEKGAERIVSSTESCSRREFLEAPHMSDPALEAAVILFKPIICADPVLHVSPQCRTDRAWVGIVPVRAPCRADGPPGGLVGQRTPMSFSEDLEPTVSFKVNADPRRSRSDRIGRPTGGNMTLLFEPVGA
jgi:hypothetical protein